MSIFPRRRSQRQPAPTPLSAPAPVEVQREKSDAAQNGESMRNIRAAQSKFVLDALAKGIDESQLSQLVVDAIADRAIPRVFILQNRNMTATFKLVDGQLPADTVTVNVTRDREENIYGANIFAWPETTSPGDNLPYTITDSGLLSTSDFSVVNVAPIDPAMRMLINDHIATTQPPAQS